MDQAEIVNSIVGSLLEEPALVDDPGWDSFALVASVTPDVAGMSGYRYTGNDAGQPTPVRNTSLSLFRELQAATLGPNDQPWNVCIVKIERDTARGTVNFVYGDEEAAIWRINPANPRQLAENLRPQPADFIA